MTVNPRRWAVVGVALLGAMAALLLLGTMRDPCAGILRRYVVTYDAVKSPCSDDLDCMLDPLPARGPGVCDRSRRASSDRGGLELLEARWREKGCPAPGGACPPIAGAVCQKGRCVTVLAR